MSDDTTGMGIPRVHFCRYPHTVDIDGGGTNCRAYQTCGMNTAIDLTRYMQIPDVGMPNIAENSASLTARGPNINIQRMAITLKGTTPVSVFA